MQFLPFLGFVIEAPEFSVGDIDSTDGNAQDNIPRGAIWGFGSRETAIRALADHLSADRKAEIYRLIGDADKSTLVIAEAVSKARDNAAALAMRLGMIGVARQNSVASIFKDQIDKLYSISSPYPKLNLSIAAIAQAENAVYTSTRSDDRSISTKEIWGIYNQATKRNNDFGSPRYYFVPGLALRFLQAAACGQVSKEYDIDLLRIFSDGDTDAFARMDLLRVLSAAADCSPLQASTILAAVNDAAASWNPHDRNSLGWLNDAYLSTAREIAVEQPNSVTEISVAKLYDRIKALNSTDLVNNKFALAMSVFANSNKIQIFYDFDKAIANLQSHVSDKILNIVLSRMALVDSSWRVDASIQNLKLLIESRPPAANRVFIDEQNFPAVEAVAAAAELAEAGIIDQSLRSAALKSASTLLSDGFGGQADGLTPGMLVYAVDKLARGLGKDVVATTVANFVNSVKNPGASNYYGDAADMLIAISRYAPEALLKQEQEIRKVSARQIGERVPGIRESLIGAIARAKYEVMRGNDNADTLLKRFDELMGTEDDFESRIFGAYGFFLFAIDNSDKLDLVRQLLLRHATSRIMGERISVYKALEMVRVAELVAESKRKGALAVSKTRQFLKCESVNPESHVRFAALVGLISLESTR